MKTEKPKLAWLVADQLAMIADDCPEHGTDAADKFKMPEQSILILKEFSEVIGVASIRRDGDRFYADCAFVEGQVPVGLYPHLQSEPSDFWQGDRVVAVGDGNDVMHVQFQDDKLHKLCALVYTATEPVDSRIPVMAHDVERERCPDLSDDSSEQSGETAN